MGRKSKTRLVTTKLFWMPIRQTYYTQLHILQLDMRELTIVLDLDENIPIITQLQAHLSLYKEDLLPVVAVGISEKHRNQFEIEVDKILASFGG